MMPGRCANLLTGLGVDQTFSRQVVGGATSSLLTDALGSTVALADASGTVQTTYTYEPFVAVRQAGAANTNPYRFTGREDDVQTGLHFYRARYYHPTLARFVSEDPLGFPGGPDPNLYAYVGNRPTMLVDPFGLEPRNDGGGGECPTPVGYYDINVTAVTTFLLSGTAGVIVSEGRLHPYVGFGVGFPPGPAGSFTWSRSSVAQGWTVGAQAQSGGAFQRGHSFARCGGAFSEIGGGWPPGLSATVYYVGPAVQSVVTGFPGPVGLFPWGLGSMGDFAGNAALILLGLSAILFRRPLARFLVAMQNKTWGYRYGDDVVRRGERFGLPLVGGLFVLLGVGLWLFNS